MKISDLRVGDMIRFGTCNRLIRAKNPKFTRNGEVFSGKYYYWFAIRNVSWTDKCYTLYAECDMKEIYKGLIKRNCSLANNKLEYRVQQNIFISAYTDNNIPDKYKVLAREMAGRVR